MLAPRPRISPSGAILISIPGWACPTEPNRKLSRRLKVSDGQVLEGQAGRHRPPGLLELRRLAPAPHRPVEDLPLDRRARLRLGDDPRVDLLEHARDAADEMG